MFVCAGTTYQGHISNECYTIKANISKNCYSKNLPCKDREKVDGWEGVWEKEGNRL